MIETDGTNAAAPQQIAWVIKPDSTSVEQAFHDDTTTQVVANLADDVIRTHVHLHSDSSKGKITSVRLHNALYDTSESMGQSLYRGNRFKPTSEKNTETTGTITVAVPLLETSIILDRIYNGMDYDILLIYSDLAYSTMPNSYNSARLTYYATYAATYQGSGTI
jgi:hypothetical protein